MSATLDDVLAANAAYAESFGSKADCPAPRPRFGSACMDARLDPAKYAGLGEGDAHVIRTPVAAPATTRSARSSSRTSSSAPPSGDSTAAMEFFTDEVIRALPTAERASARRFIGRGPGSAEPRLAAIGPDGQVVDDVRRIRQHPLIRRIRPRLPSTSAAVA